MQMEMGRNAGPDAGSKRWRLKLSAMLAGAALTVTILTPARADQASSILSKVVSAYNTARSYRGTIRIHQVQATSKGKSATVSIEQRIRYKKPNLFTMDITMTAEGGPASAGGPRNSIATSDGRTFYRYDPSRKLYQKGPAPAAVPLASILGVMPRPGTATFTLGRDLVFEGHPAYTLILKPILNLPPNVSAAARAAYAKLAQPQDLIIDKRTYQLLHVSRHGPPLTVDVSFSNQQFNPALGSSIFSFVPPPGAKEFKMPTAPAGPPAGPQRPPGH